MQQSNPFDQFDAPLAPSAYSTITTPRDPRRVAQEDAAAARAVEADRRAAAAAERDRQRFAERDKPTLPAGYMMRPDGRTAVRIPGLPPEKGAEQPGQRDLDSVRAEAIDKIRLARTLQQRSRDGWFATGLGAKTVGSFSGTGAYDVAQDTDTLKNAGALTRIMEMAKQNGGKNPLTPLSNSDFQALASSLSNLDTGQSDEQYQANVQRVIDLYARAYQGAGGRDLEGDLDPDSRRRDPVAPSQQLGGPGNNGGGGGVNRSFPVYDDNGPSGGFATLATGGTRTVENQQRSAAIDALIRGGADIETINRTAQSLGGTPVSSSDVAAARAYLRKNPSYRGSLVSARDTLPTTVWNRAAGSELGSGPIDVSFAI